MIIVYVILYEWVGIFDVGPIRPVVHVLKIVLPLSMLLFVSRLKPPEYFPLKQFHLYFLLFMIWGMIPSAFSPFYQETMVQWAKFLPRLLFCYIVCIFLLQNPAFLSKIAKILVIIGVLTVIQYILMSIFYTSAEELAFKMPIPRGGRYYGPFGILGNGNAVIKINDEPIFRLTGFWLEPSTASGFMIMASSLAQVLNILLKQLRWKLASLVCLAGGVLTFSNAAYVVIEGSLFIGVFVSFMIAHRDVKSFNSAEAKRKRLFYLAGGISLLLIMFFTLFSRSIVNSSDFLYQNSSLRYLAGVRTAVPIRPDTPPLLVDSSAPSDIYGGRLKQAKKDILELFKNPLGKGFRIPGRDYAGRGVDVSSSAILMWLVYTGFIGLLLLVLRDSQVIIVSFKEALHSPLTMALFQAWAALWIQNVFYGTWMNPVFFVSVAFLFTTIYHTANPAGDPLPYKNRVLVS